MRKSIFATFTAAVAVAAALLLTGCERAIDMTGRPVSFAAGISDGASGPKTRVAYGVETSGAQAIDWIEGDHITIYCEACEDKKIAMYEVQDVKKASAADMHSYAGLVNAESDGAGLRWGTGEHTFYAVYPSPEEDRSITIGIGPYSDGGTRSSVAKSISNNIVTAAIPSRQKVIGSVTESDGIWTATPDLTNMLMTAKSTYSAETGIPDGSVFLDFKPLTTVLEFTIKKEDSDLVMDISSVSLTSEGHALSGRFKVDMDVNGKYTTTGTWCTEGSGRPETTLASATPSEADRKVTINFGSPVKLAKEQSLTFTFFLNPGNDVDDLTFSISGTVGKDGETKESFNRKTALKKSDGTGVAFPTHQKTRISGLMLPDAIAWTVTYAPTVQSWNQSGTGIDPMPETDGEPFVTSWDTEINEELTLEPELVKWIDLGLPSGKLWADRNVGANASYEVGDYYSWGETELWYTAIEGNTVTMKSEYDQFSWTEYAAKSNMKSIISNLTGTYAIYDVARLLYGNDCHIPSDNEYWELANNCYWRYVDSYHGQSVEGYMIFKAKADADKGKYTLENPIYTPVATYNESDTHIFLPYSGFITKKTVRSGNIDSGPAGKNVGYYLTSTTGQVALTETHAGEAGYERFAIGTNKPNIATVPRHAGMPIRAVKQKQKTIEYVEIGGLKWATMNLGATKPEEPGLYFAWGDVVGQYAATTGTGAFTKSYEYVNEPFNNGSSSNNTTYFNTYQSLWITDATLKPDYDAANVLIGGGWRMPTKEDLDNLLSNTNQVKVTDYNGTGVTGWICTSKTDDTKAIFLPATGYGDKTSLSNASAYGCYWSSTLTVTNKGNAERLTLGETVTGNNSRYQGRCIRPVHD